MARISYDTFQETAAATANNNNDGIKLFSLKNDGDEAVVRIMHDNVADFDIISTHPVKIGDRTRKVSCIRDPREPIDNCPLCKSGAKIQQRFFIHMIQYKQEADGRITPVPCVWERAAGEYATKLKTLIDEYGPLSDLVFKVRRNGKAGSMDTTYEILYANPNIYRAELYPKDTKPFENYTAFGKIVLDKTFEEISEFISTGSFPQRGQGVSEARAKIDVMVEDDNVGQLPNPSMAPEYTPIPNYIPQTATPPMGTGMPPMGSGVPPITTNPAVVPQTPMGDVNTSTPPARPTRYY